MCSSDVFVSVLSKAALAPFAQLTAASACDNVLLEQQLALELYKRGDLRAIYPVLVGELKHINDEFGDLYGDFFKSGGVPACPDEVVKAVEDKVAEHLERLGKGALSTERTVKATLDAITQFQAVKLSGNRAEATDKVVAVSPRLSKFIGSTRHATHVNRCWTGSRDLPNLQSRPLTHDKGPRI